MNTLLIISYVAALPVTNNLATPQVNGLPFYFPKNQLKQFSYTQGLESKVITKDDAKAQLASDLGVVAEDLEITWASSEGKVQHFYANLVSNGLLVKNNQASIHFRDGQVISTTASFSKESVQLSKRQAISQNPEITEEEAIKIAEENYNLPRSESEVTKAYIQKPDGAVALTYELTVRDDEQGKWYLVNVDAKTGDILSTVNYYQSASFTAIELPNKDPTDGLTNINNPENLNASPNGWTNGETAGNNVDSRLRNARVQGQGEDNLSFDVTLDENAQPEESGANQAAAIINTFYISNMVHDITFEFGFDEASGNFQAENFGEDGLGGDAVVINNQAPGSNNANFATPPDGQTPVMNMFTFTLSNPRRDGSLDNEVPIHEYFHGVSNRLTGGPAAANCLAVLESRGLGEGWSDIGAIMLTMSETDTREKVVGLGSFAANNPNGIRLAPYSTDINTNPLTFADAANFQIEHQIGSVWASALYEVYFNLVDEFGFSSNWFDATQKRGNIIAMQLIISAMKLQPCNPTMIEARDAILQADNNQFNGEMRCFLMAGFAKRGLGVNAREGFVNGFETFDDC